MNQDNQRFVLMAAAAQAHYVKEQARRERARRRCLAKYRLYPIQVSQWIRSCKQSWSD
jgi:hypothetical protein